MTGRRQWVIWGTVILGIAIVAYFVFLPARNPAGPPLEMTIAVTSNPDSALVQIAQHEGYFRDEGLAVTMERFTSGKASLEALLQGKAQLATVAETPIVLNILRGANLVVVAGIFHSDHNMGIVARRDRGITTASDLRGKTVGVPLGTNAEYFLYAFHTVEGIPDSDITLAGMPPEATAKALLAGRVDAVAVWNPFFHALQKSLGDGGVSFYGEHVYTYTFNLAAKRDFAAAHPLHITALLRALLKAESLIHREPAKAHEIVAGFTHWDKRLLDDLWGGYSFRLSLDQALLVSMENQARWALDTGLVPPQALPNFFSVMYLDGLQAVAPGRITVAH